MARCLFLSINDSNWPRCIVWRKNKFFISNKTIGKSKLGQIELNQQGQKQFIQETLGPKQEKVGMWQEKQRELAKNEPTPYKEVKNMRSEERMFYRSNNNDLKHHKELESKEPG